MQTRTMSSERHRVYDARLHRRLQRGDRGAGEELAGRYLPLARRLAQRYRNHGEPIDDLVQVASVGLALAIRRWDPGRGTAFSSFAMPTILGELRRYFRDSTWAVKAPRSKRELASVVAGAADALSRGGSRVPAAAEIAEALGRPEAEVRDVLRAAAGRRADSLDALSQADGPTTLELLGDADPGYAQVESEIAFDDLTSRLDRRSREVVRMRFSDDLIQREIGARMGLSQMTVSRILDDALGAMAA
jgi:RNA polymerase sigma-B factor